MRRLVVEELECRRDERALADRQLADDVLQQGVDNALALLGADPQS